MKMRNLFLLAIMLVVVVGGNTYGQILSQSATYTVGDIGTDNAFTPWSGESSTCPGILNVDVPNGVIIYSVDVEYSMTANSPSQIQHQVSQFRCVSPGGLNASEKISGPSIWNPGTQLYSMTGLTLANGVTPTAGVDFELHAGNSDWQAPVGCSSATNKVDNNTWIVTVYYLPVGAPGFPSNPTPADASLLVSIDADLTWDFSSDTDTYDVYWGTDNPPTTLLVDNQVPGGATGSSDVGTMAYNTTYYWYVVDKNAIHNTVGDVWSYTTECESAIMPIVENFDAVTAPAFPSCWATLNSSTLPLTRVENFWDEYGNWSYSAPNVIRFIAESEPTPNLILVLPKVGIISDKMISFYGRNEWNIYPFEVGTLSDPTDISTFTVYETFSPGDTWEQTEIFFNAYSGTDEYIGIRGAMEQYNKMFLDNVVIDYIPSCIKPKNLTWDASTTSSATIGWTDPNDPAAILWNIEYVLEGNTPTGVPNFTGVTTNPFEVTGLLSTSYYDIYVQTDCGGGDESYWSDPITVLTDCEPFEVPFFEDFGVYPPWPEQPTLPLCWNTINISSGFGGVFIQDYNAHTGLGIAMAAEGDPTAQLILVGPAISPALNTLKVSFWAKASGSGDRAIILGTISDPLDYTTFSPFDTISGLTEVHQYFTFYFDDYAGTDIQLAWRNNSEEYPNVQVFIDDITVEGFPSCVEPYLPWVDGETTSSAMLNWEIAVSGTNWDIEVGAAGFLPGTASYTNTYTYSNPSAVDSESFEMTGLNAATVSDVYIRTNCGGGEYSVWAGPIAFLTGFETFTTLPVAEDFEAGLGLTGNDPHNNDTWEIDNTIQVSGTNSIKNSYSDLADNSLIILGKFDLTAKTDVSLSFRHIAKTEGNYDLCYVEISTDGGVTFDQLPESTYAGSGVYSLHGYENPEGPSFDELSYPQWVPWGEIPDNSWWRKEYFDLTSYNTFNEVEIRFRLVANSFTQAAGWWIDDIVVESLNAPVFYVTPLSITENVTSAMPATTNLTLGNSGGFPAEYSTSVLYNESDLLSENFDAGIPATWSIVNGGNSPVTWATGTSAYNGYDFDGTSFAICDGYQGWVAGSVLMDEEMISPVVDASAYTTGGLLLEFDQAFDASWDPGDTARVYVYDGTEWIMIYESWEDDGLINWETNGIHKSFNVTQYANANFRVKFHYIEGSTDFRGEYFAIDNFRIRASMFPLGWLTIDATELLSGVAFPDTDNLPSTINVTMNSTGLAVGVYTADIEVTSTDPGFNTTLIPVTMNVVAGSTISGNVTYNNTAMTALNGCSVELRNASDAVLFTATTDAAGYYGFPGLIDGDYTVHTSCTKAWGGMTTFDATLILRFAAGVPGFDMLTNLKKRAADVNMTNTAAGVTTFDATLILRRAASVATPQWTAPDFVFDGPYPSTPALSGYTVTISGSNATVNYQGLCSGDVNGNYAPPAE